MEPVVDPSNPFHQASFYLEDLKWGEGPRTARPPEMQNFREEAIVLLREAGVTMDPDEFVEAVWYYSANWARTTGGPAEIIHSIFLEGVMLGIAFHAGLKGSNPYKEADDAQTS